MIKGRRTNAKCVPFGEVVFLNIPKTKYSVGDFQDRWQQGIWVGYVMRAGEHIVATRTGTFTVSTVMRRSEGKQWSKELLKEIIGSLGEPVPGSGYRKLQAFAKKFEDAKPDAFQFMPATPQEQQVRAAFIYKKDILHHGAIPGCIGCRASATGQYRAKHNQECRQIFEKMFMECDAGRRRMAIASRRIDEAVVRASGMPAEQPDEPESKRQKDEGPVSLGGGERHGS